MAVLVGGIGQLYQGDFDLGRLAAERLSKEDLGHDVLVEDFHYGAVAVAQRLEEVRPQTLVLVGAAERGRAPGTVERRLIDDPELPVTEIQKSIGDAIVGYVTMDLVVEVGFGFRVLPSRTVAVEVEPANTESSETISPEAAVALDQALELVRAEVRRAPLFELADRIRGILGDGRLEASPALEALEGLLAELHVLDEEGRWGAAFALKDRLKLKISAGETGYGMDHLDWGLWWALIEELERLQPLEASSGL